MYIRINNADQLRDEFTRMGRGDQFSPQALRELYDYLEQVEEETGEEFELDVIALCVEWAEYDFDDAKSDYRDLDGMDEAEDLDDVAAILEQETAVIRVPGTPDTLLVEEF